MDRRVGFLKEEGYWLLVAGLQGQRCQSWWRNGAGKLRRGFVGGDLSW